MKFYKMGIALLLLVSVVMYSFTAKKARSTNTFYQYIGFTQLPADRSNANNYKKSSVNPCLPSAGDNECGVMLNRDFGMTPNFSSVTFNTITGMPNGGAFFVANYLEVN